MIPFVDGASPSFCFVSLRVPFFNRASQSLYFVSILQGSLEVPWSVIGFGKVGIGFCRVASRFFCGQGFGGLGAVGIWVWGLGFRV